jgi:hypothetical protein
MSSLCGDGETLVPEGRMDLMRVATVYINMGLLLKQLEAIIQLAPLSMTYGKETLDGMNAVAGDEMDKKEIEAWTRSEDGSDVLRGVGTFPVRQAEKGNVYTECLHKGTLVEPTHENFEFYKLYMTATEYTHLLVFAYITKPDAIVYVQARPGGPIIANETTKALLKIKPASTLNSYIMGTLDLSKEWNDKGIFVGDMAPASGETEPLITYPCVFSATNFGKLKTKYLFREKLRGAISAWAKAQDWAERIIEYMDNQITDVSVSDHSNLAEKLYGSSRLNDLIAEMAHNGGYSLDFFTHEDHTSLGLTIEIVDELEDLISVREGFLTFTYSTSEGDYHPLRIKLISHHNEYFKVEMIGGIEQQGTLYRVQAELDALYRKPAPRYIWDLEDHNPRAYDVNGFEECQSVNSASLGEPRLECRAYPPSQYTPACASSLLYDKELACPLVHQKNLEVYTDECSGRSNSVLTRASYPAHVILKCRGKEDRLATLIGNQDFKQCQIYDLSGVNLIDSRSTHTWESRADVPNPGAGIERYSARHEIYKLTKKLLQLKEINKYVFWALLGSASIFVTICLILYGRLASCTKGCCNPDDNGAETDCHFCLRGGCCRRPVAQVDNIIIQQEMVPLARGEGRSTFNAAK